MEDADLVCVCVCVCVWDTVLEIICPRANSLQLSPRGVFKGKNEDKLQNLKGMYVSVSVK